jgi:inner membrane transporter RhtA
MIVGTSASIQVAAAVAHDLFQRLGPTGTSALRFTLGAGILLTAVRPRLEGRDRRTWVAIATYGTSLAALNVTFFEAIERLPMGIAVTFAFVAPLLMALAGSRRRRDLCFALLAGAGVVLLGGISRPGSGVGVAFALTSGAAWASVAYSGRSVGQRTSSLDGLALSIPIAALVTLPLGAAHLGAIDPRALGLGTVIAVGGLILPFALELEGLRRLEPRIVAVIYSLDPAVAAVVGFVGLGQSLTGPELLGMGAVIVASVGAISGSALRSTDPACRDCNNRKGYGRDGTAFEL